MGPDTQNGFFHNFYCHEYTLELGKRVGAVLGWPKGVGGIIAVVLMASEYFGTATLHSAPDSSGPGDWYLTTTTPKFLILPHLDASETEQENGGSSFGSSTSWTIN
ncbi:hypothetical protein KQX54_018682 [Cotesia glomerata]|uniref:Uncharacterized protein n=1 Tax=Cotesia glomerata TaxID=32391 RepID=A0AAV7ID85_COTGL|nr:hypothetical protein KQX54_018682 [Cotesia glomerata]